MIRYWKGLLACAVLFVVLLYYFYQPYPKHLQSGDLIFQTYADSSQTLPIMIATGSLYSHVGIVKRKPDGTLFVVDSAGIVGESPLEEWIDNGVFKRFSVYRLPSLSETIQQEVLGHARTYYGQEYDIFFHFDNGKLYCSELPYLAFLSAGITLGKVQTIGELRVGNVVVQSLIKRRWQKHPSCGAADIDYEACLKILYQQPLISPASLARDSMLEHVYSNYGFGF